MTHDLMIDPVGLPDVSRRSHLRGLPRQRHLSGSEFLDGEVRVRGAGFPTGETRRLENRRYYF
jgi:hypothetical protein